MIESKVIEDSFMFDRTGTTQNLENTGMPHQQAEGVVVAIEAAATAVSSEAATKSDLAELAAGTKSDIADLAELIAGTKADLAELAAATKSDIAELAGLIKEISANMDAKLDTMQVSLRSEFQALMKQEFDKRDLANKERMELEFKLVRSEMETQTAKTEALIVKSQIKIIAYVVTILGALMAYFEFAA